MNEYGSRCSLVVDIVSEVGMKVAECRAILGCADWCDVSCGVMLCMVFKVNYNVPFFRDMSEEAALCRNMVRSVIMLCSSSVLT